MSPRFLWFFLGAGVGAWWATNKRMNIDCKFQRTLPAPPMEYRPPFNASEAGPEQAPSYNHDWPGEQERARVREFSRTAEDTVSCFDSVFTDPDHFATQVVELSEATLSTIMQATEALRAVRMLNFFLSSLE
ncbi:hypothetical protein B0H19DRAFT_1108901 [Mycena capillaripes]|nr:hypothetical protein B0H19DRAFT_1108901 [Mycena capillaripes]